MSKRSTQGWFRFLPASALGILLVSCQVPPGGGAATQPGARAGQDLDPDKAFLKLSQIEPAVELPASPTTQPAELPPQAVRSVVAGKELRQKGRFTEAIFELEKALQYAPRSHEVNRLLALVCREAGNDGRAISHLKKAVEEKADDVVCRYLLGLYAQQDKNDGEALKQFRLALKCPNATRESPYRALTVFRLAEHLRDQGYLTAAAEQYEEFVRLTAEVHPSFEETPELLELIRLKRGYVATRIAGLWDRVGQTKRAVGALADVAGRFPDDVELQETYARLLSRAGQHREAMEVARRLVEAKAADARSIELLLAVYESAGKVDQALDVLQQLHAQHPEDTALMIALFDALVKRGSVSAAEKLLRDEIVRRPDDQELRWRLIGFHEGQGRWLDAVTAASDAVEAEPASAARVGELIDRLVSRKEAVRTILDRTGSLLAERPNTYGLPYVLGLLAARVGDNTRALQMQEKCVETQADFLPGVSALAEVHLGRYEWSRAIEVVQAALKKGLKSASFERILGEAFDGLDDVEQAVTHYTEAIRLDLNDVETMIRLARLYERSGQSNRAKLQYTTILANHSGAHEAREALFRMYMTPPLDLSNAKKLLETFQRLGSDTPAYARCVKLYQFWVRQLKERANPKSRSDVRPLTAYVKGLVDVAEKFPEDVPSLYWAAMGRFSEHDYDGANQWCERVLSREPDHIDAQELRFHICQRQLDYDAARGVLEKLLSERPNRRAWRELLLRQHLIEQNFDRAVDVCERLVAEEKTDRQKDEYRAYLVDALQLAGRSDEAVRRIDQWIKEVPKSLTYRLLKLQTLQWSGQTEAAVAFAESWHREDPNNMQAKLQLFEALVRHDDPFKAQRLVLQWLSEDPENKMFNALLMAGLTAADQFEDAIELARNAVPSGDEKIQGLRRLAEVYRVAGRHAERVRVLQQVARDQRKGVEEIRPEDSMAVIQALLAAERFREAEQQLTLHADEEQDPLVKKQWLQLLSFCYLRDKKFRLAVKVLEDVLEMFPKDPGVSNDLGYTLADEGVQLDRAEKLIRFAVGEKPRTNAYLDSLGWALYKKGDFAGAKSWLTRAVRCRSMLEGGEVENVDDPVLYDHRGDALWRLGEKEEAVQSWGKAVSLFERLLRRHVQRNDEEVLENARKKLEAVKNGQLPGVAPVGKKEAA